MISQDDAMAFFDACETGKGWEACKAYCAPGATFKAQAEPLAEISTLEGYTDWMAGLFTPIPDGSYTLEAFAVDPERGRIVIYGVFNGSHTGEGGPVPATGQRTSSDYVYVIDSADGKITHMTKIWHAGWAMRELGWG